MPEFPINIPELEGKSPGDQDVLGGRRDYAWPVRQAWLVEQLDGTDLAAPEDPQDGALTVTAQKVGEDVLVEGHVTAAIQAPCARCLELTTIPIDADFTQYFTNRAGSTPIPEELELTPEDLERETYQGETLALDALVREFIILELPMTPKCEGGCKDPIVNRILGGGGDGREQPAKKGALAALLDLKIDKKS